MQRLREILQRLVRQKDIHHAVVAVASCDGSFEWSDAVPPRSKNPGDR